MMARTQARMHAIASPLQVCPTTQRSKHDANVKRGVQRRLTTMPMSDLVLSSTVLSSTRFMNWSNPRSVPVTCRLAFSATASQQQDVSGRPEVLPERSAARQAEVCGRRRTEHRVQAKPDKGCMGDGHHARGRRGEGGGHGSRRSLLSFLSMNPLSSGG